MNTAAIVKAFERRFKLRWAKEKIAWENFNFIVPAGPYYEINFLFAKPVNLGYADEHTRLSGYCQVTMRFPANVGGGDARAEADQLALEFKRGLSLEADGVTTVVEETPEVGNGSNEGDRFVIRVKIRFYANIIKEA